MTVAPIDLFSSGIHLHPNGDVDAGERRMTGDFSGWTLAAFHVETQEDVHGDLWEMHPEADEVVAVLSGAARFVLRPETGAREETVVSLAAGSAFIVPRGRWHRVELDGPSDLMSLTLRRGTRLEKRRHDRGHQSADQSTDD